METTPAYPDICFAVDDFDSTFDAVVMFLIDHMISLFVFPSMPTCTESSNWELEIGRSPTFCNLYEEKIP